MEANINDYLKNRVDDQINYFDVKALENQKKYKRIKSIAIVCNILTTMTIALAFTVPENFKVFMGIVALILSTLVLATYQWEEFQNYGAKWEKFRLVAEELKTEKMLFVHCSGPYKNDDAIDNEKRFIEKVEMMMKQTDVSYFSLMVEPGKRIEKRISNVKGS